jgi:hypothetical protein
MPYEHVRPVPVVAFNSVNRAAASIGIRPERLSDAIRKGLCPAHRVGVKTIVLVRDLEAFVRLHPSATRSACHAA